MGKLEWNHLLLTGPKKKRKWRKSFGIFMFIVNNSIFKSMNIQFFLARSISLKECYQMMNFLKKLFCSFKIAVKMQI